jgi:NADPH-dependent curcumin reductase
MDNPQVLLVQRPEGMAKNEDFQLVHTPWSPLAEGEVRVQNHFISLDPAMRGWMNAGTTYIKGVALGEVMRAFGVGIVAESNHPAFVRGDAVQGLTGVQQFAVMPASSLTAIPDTRFPLSWHLGVLGMPGLTAYFGLLDKGQPKAGETVLVSGAAGMVGSLVGQIARLKGCTVIGIAGGQDKCDYVTQTLGFDACINYKDTADIAKAIHHLAPKGINIYFDNVGGDILDAAMLNLALGARVVICGAISQYNDAAFNGLKHYMKIVSARGTISGIIVFDYFPRAAEAIAALGAWLDNGQLYYREHLVEGLDQFPTALRMLFTGENYGKLILKL